MFRVDSSPRSARIAFQNCVHKRNRLVVVVLDVRMYVLRVG
jgi:hypothetical protein